MASDPEKVDQQEHAPNGHIVNGNTTNTNVQVPEGTPIPVSDPAVAPADVISAPATADASSSTPSRPVSTKASSVRLPPHTQVTYDPEFHEPPDLNYSLHARKNWIIFFWGLVIVDCIFMPIALYFGLWYGTSLSHNAVFSISTGLLGTVSIVEYFLRFHRLWKKDSKCRVIGAKRMYLDWFHWNLSFAWIAVMIELIVGTVPEEPPIRLLAMPCSSMLYAFGVQLLVIDVARLAGVKSPVRISSLPRGSPLRPGIYSVIEDIIAVDGSGGTEFRQRLNLRYQASKMFRQMLHHLTLFWAFGALAAAVLTTVLIFTLQRDAAYVVGWVIPFLWAGIWAAITTKWVQISLKKEYAQWSEAKWKA